MISTWRAPGMAAASAWLACRRRDAILVGADHQRGDQRQLRQPIGGVVAVHGAQLLRDEARLVGQVATEHQPHVLGQQIARHDVEHRARHEQLERGVAAHAAGSEPAAQASAPLRCVSCAPLANELSSDRLRMRSGAIRASSWATSPPIDCPTTWKRRMRLAFMIASASLAIISTVIVNSSTGAPSAPRLLNATTSKRSASPFDLRMPPAARHPDPLDQEHGRSRLRRTCTSSACLVCPASRRAACDRACSCSRSPISSSSSSPCPFRRAHPFHGSCHRPRRCNWAHLRQRAHRASPYLSGG